MEDHATVADFSELLADYHIHAGMFSIDQMKQIETVMASISNQALMIKRTVDQSGKGFSDFYSENNTLVVVPEISDSDVICRMEFLAGFSEEFITIVVKPVQTYLEHLLRVNLNLFKDKCNFKNPNGGAFPPHQDAPAYQGFGPDYFVTAAVFLDDASEENGCLCFAKNWKVQLRSDRFVRGLVESSSLIVPHYQGGEKNGVIREEWSDRLDWQPIYAKAGDTIIFDSLAPHFSNPNHSYGTRRALFLTFNLASEGDHYRSYYEQKWSNFGDPKFHVATPTKHDTRLA